MNLPALAIEFLDSFRGLYQELYKLEGAREAVEAAELPMVHCYCFTKDMESAEKDILEVSSMSSFPSRLLTDRLHAVSVASVQSARDARHDRRERL
jgi:tRNA (guanine37-N1)-methyltransferase